VLLALAACSSSKSGSVGEGGECELATDCAEGLICEAPANGGTRVCSSDLSGVQKTPPKPGDAGRPIATDAAGVGDAPTSEPDTGAPAADAAAE
jgi:hypothetical protein